MSNWDLGFGLEPAESHGTEDYPGDDDDTYDAPYPITYERDDSDAGPSWPAAPRPASPQPPAPSPWPPTPHPAARYGRDEYVPGADGRASADPMGASYPDSLAGEEPWLDQVSSPGRRRWLIPAGVVVLAAVIGATLVLLAGGHSSAPAAAGAAKPATSASPASSRPAGRQTSAPRKAAAAVSPPLTLAAAAGVLSDYTTVNNSANAERSDSELAMVETGGSYAIDAGLYTIGRADGASPYPAFSPAAATYYIPRAEPADGPRWFVVRVANAFSANPNKVTSTEYLLFTQSAPGGTWLNAVEPYLLTGADAPQIEIGGDGLATAVSVTSASLAAAPDQLAGLTAATLDGTGSAVSVPASASAELPDRLDQKFWQTKLATATVIDAHAPATGTVGQTFALLTTNGGALVFYTDSAELTITPPPGSELHLTVPGLYSADQAVALAGLTYLDQFAAYDPPPNSGSPTVLAEYSGLTGKN